MSSFFTIAGPTRASRPVITTMTAAVYLFEGDLVGGWEGIGWCVRGWWWGVMVGGDVVGVGVGGDADWKVSRGE